mgnify:CR=1 FL=1
MPKEIFNFIREKGETKGFLGEMLTPDLDRKRRINITFEMQIVPSVHQRMIFSFHSSNQMYFFPLTNKLSTYINMFPVKSQIARDNMYIYDNYILYVYMIHLCRTRHGFVYMAATRGYIFSNGDSCHPH